MKIFLDSEFTGLRQDTTLISIGLVTERGREFYAEFTDYDRLQVSDWIQRNVVDNLIYTASIDSKKTIQHFTEGAHVGVMGTTREIASVLLSWLEENHLIDKKPIKIWSDCPAYDWVLFCQLLGGALNLPTYIYYIPFDICTRLEGKDIDPDVNREEFAGMADGAQKHNALWDAKVIKACYVKLSGLPWR